MKWQEDLIKDIRTHSDFDYKDLPELDSSFNHPLGYNYENSEITECNRLALLQQFSRIKHKTKSILEVGTGRNGQGSFAYVLNTNKNKDAIYIGIDIEDRSFLRDTKNNIHTIQNDSINYYENVHIFRDYFNVEQFDFILIDTPHSINQLLLDWEYTNLLTDGGIVAIHDTSCHPGPKLFMQNLNRNKWTVIENCCPEDWGIGFAWKKMY